MVSRLAANQLRRHSLVGSNPTYSAWEGMPRWLGAPCFENSDTVLPWRFDTSTFRSGAVVQRKHAGPSTRRMSDRNRPASLSRHRIKAVRRVLHPEAGGRYPVAVPRATIDLICPGSAE